MIERMGNKIPRIRNSSRVSPFSERAKIVTEDQASQAEVLITPEILEAYVFRAANLGFEDEFINSVLGKEIPVIDDPALQAALEVFLMRIPQQHKDVLKEYLLDAD